MKLAMGRVVSGWDTYRSPALRPVESPTGAHCKARFVRGWSSWGLHANRTVGKRGPAAGLSTRWCTWMERAERLGQQKRPVL